MLILDQTPFYKAIVLNKDPTFVKKVFKEMEQDRKE